MLPHLQSVGELCVHFSIRRTGSFVCVLLFAVVEWGGGGD